MTIENYTIEFDGKLLPFETVELWNNAIMAILWENPKLTSIKNGLGNCIIE